MATDSDVTAENLDPDTDDTTVAAEVASEFLDMSDDAFIEASDKFIAAEDISLDVDIAVEGDSVDDASDSDSTDTGDTDADSDTSTSSDDTEADDNGDTDSTDDDSTSDSDSAADDADSTDDADADSATDDESASVAALAFFEKITAPFKANGKDMQVDNVDDAIRLMQMGANYNRKMAGLKPNFKLLKTLEQNDLLSEEKLGFLIDLDKKNPEAIAKLLKDSGINPLELDLEKDSEYKATDYSPDERELSLDSVIDDIRDSKNYDRTLNIVSNKWDEPSKQAVADNPQLLKVLNTQLDNGVYDIVNTEVEKQRMFGQLKDVSDVDAYQRVGDALYKAGALTEALGEKSPTELAAAAKDIPATPNKKDKVADKKRNDKRKAASATKQGAKKTTPKAISPLDLPDDEYMKLGDAKFM